MNAPSAVILPAQAGTQGSPAAFACADLRVALDNREVLHALTLSIPAGRWTAVAGPNGAGKTTLLKALAQLIPSSGAIHLLGSPAAAWSPRERARTIAWLGQAEAGAEDLLAQDVVMLGRLPHQHWLGVPGAEDHAAVRDAMQETQSWEWRDRPLGSLSGGERQRVLLARALAVQAPILLMDEPLSHLDPPHQADWLALVRRHVARSGTAVSVLHEIGLALHADELLLLQDGRVAHHGPAADAATHRAIEQVFDQRVQVHAVAGRWVTLPKESA